MPSKYLHGFYAFFTLSIAVSGIVSIVFSLLWRRSDLLLNMTFSHADLTAGLAVGIALLLTSSLSVGAIIQRNHVTIGLVILNWALIADAVIVLVVGSFIWFYTLRERSEFHTQYAKLQSSQRITIQDQFNCCGYFNASDLIEFGGSFCQNSTFANALNITITSNFCVTPVTKHADTSLNNVFSTIYGFMAGIIGLFLSSLCVIKVRQEIERFRKIDTKRGGKGFV
ncbi:tetraspanin Pls1 family [Multifurca ochricompacta]|uniref:Tetraspanin Pls1 family n=1 Tax=Multifurca ochricompacta TaxID=376703 RepID=A0AAD4MB04_9AGAM|nr:tetraspanin Pls1 family [Multifurca ochricompacta]